MSCEKNLTYIRPIFFAGAQKHSEPIDSYVTELKNKAKDCEFGDLHDSLVKDCINITTSQVKALTEEVEMNTVKSVRKKDFREKKG